MQILLGIILTKILFDLNTSYSKSDGSIDKYFGPDLPWKILKNIEYFTTTLWFITHMAPSALKILKNIENYWKLLRDIEEEKNAQTNWMFSNLTLVHHPHCPHLPRHQLRHQYPGHLEQNHVGRIHIVLDRNSLEEEIKFLSWRAISLHQGWNCRSPFHYDLPRCISPGQKKTMCSTSSKYSLKHKTFFSLFII